MMRSCQLISVLMGLPSSILLVEIRDLHKVKIDDARLLCRPRNKAHCPSRQESNPQLALSSPTTRHTTRAWGPSALSPHST